MAVLFLVPGRPSMLGNEGELVAPLQPPPRPCGSTLSGEACAQVTSAHGLPFGSDQGRCRREVDRRWRTVAPF